MRNRLPFVFILITLLLDAMGIGQVDGVLLDLGVSSPQLDTAERGFSFMKDGPLDMRMDNSKGPTAAEWLVNIEEEALANIIFQYGEERYSRRIAKAIKGTANAPKQAPKPLLLKPNNKTAGIATA